MSENPHHNDEPVIPMERLLEMANQIGDFFEPYPTQRKHEGIRNHLRTYWDPRMREALLSYIDQGGTGLQPSVIAGANLLRAANQAINKSYYGPPKGVEKPLDRTEWEQQH